MAWDVLSGVTKTVWDVLSSMANGCGMFYLRCRKMAWDVLSHDVLSYIPFPLVSWVRCGAWLYRFLIFALFLTLIDQTTNRGCIRNRIRS